MEVSELDQKMDLFFTVWQDMIEEARSGSLKFSGLGGDDVKLGVWSVAVSGDTDFKLGFEGIVKG